MMLEGTSDGPEPVADAGQFLNQLLGVIIGDGLGCLDDAMIVRAAVLADMLVGIAKIPLVIRRQFWEKCDDVACVAPAAKDDQRFLLFHGCCRIVD
jgi:hypothetical protein